MGCKNSVPIIESINVHNTEVQLILIDHLHELTGLSSNYVYLFLAHLHTKNMYLTNILDTITPETSSTLPCPDIVSITAHSKNVSYIPLYYDKNKKSMC